MHRLVFAIHKSWENGFGQFLDERFFNPMWEGDPSRDFYNIDLFQLFRDHLFIEGSRFGLPQSVVRIIGQFVAGSHIYTEMFFRGKIEMTSFEGKKFGKAIPSLRGKWKEMHGNKELEGLELELDSLRESCSFVEKYEKGGMRMPKDFLLPKGFEF